MSNTNREPAGSIGPDGKRNGGRFASAIFGKGDLPLLSADFQERSPALSKAHETLAATGMPYALDVTSTGQPSEMVISGAILVHEFCSRCGSPLGNRRKLERLVQEEEQSVACPSCNRTVDAISVRVMIRESMEETFDAITAIATSLRNDVGRGVTAREQKMMDDAFLTARLRLSESQSQLTETPSDILDLPAFSAKEEDVSVLIMSPDNRLLLSVSVWADGESRFGLQTVRVPVPDLALREMIENYEKSKAFLSADSEEQRLWVQAVESWKIKIKEDS
ncbi:MAG: hypothetical protein ACYCU8_00590 [Ferrimicrobium acidiphilum]